MVLAALYLGSLLILNAKQADDAAQLDGLTLEEIKTRIIEELAGQTDSVDSVETDVETSVEASVGDYKFSVREEDHDGWLLCDGRAVSRSTYADLFELLEIDFGDGDKTSTFNLPDARSRVPGATGEGEGLSNRTIAEAVGEETHTLTMNEMPSHDHSHNHSYDYSHNHSYEFNNINGSINIRGWSQHLDPWSNPEETTVGGAIDGEGETGEPSEPSGVTQNTAQPTGGSQAHNIMQPTLFIGNLFIYAGQSGN